MTVFPIGHWAALESSSGLSTGWGSGEGERLDEVQLGPRTSQDEQGMRAGIFSWSQPGIQGGFLSDQLLPFPACLTFETHGILHPPPKNPHLPLGGGK